MKTLTFIPEENHYRVKGKDSRGNEINYLCSWPKFSGEIATIENYSVGCGHSCHANIDVSGSVKGMKKLGYWRESDTILKHKGYYYNMSSTVCSDPLDELCFAIENGTHSVEKLNNPLRYIFKF